MNTYQPFVNASPVWAEGLEKEMNIICGFYAEVNKKESSRYFLKVAASSFYRVFINSKFVYYGPARCAHDFYRVDELEVGAYMGEGKNAIAIEVVGYNINGFYSLNQPSFLQAELFENGKSLAATAPEGGFSAFLLRQRRQKMQRFSFQRAFGESYVFEPGVDDWRKGDFSKAAPVRCVKTEKKALIPRSMPLTKFTEARVKTVISRGRVETGVIPPSYKKDRSLTNISPELKGFPEDQLEIHLSDEIQELGYTDRRAIDAAYTGVTALAEKEFEILSLGQEKTGFICFDLHCKKDGILYVMVDETLIQEDVDPLSMECLNAIRFDVKEGDYTFQSFETFGFSYLKLVCIDGEFEVENLRVCEYCAPVEIVTEYKGDNPNLKKIYEAAVETFRQNAPDLFLDCPTRERAGWLCDSFFLGRVEKLLSGENQIEKAFLENFLIAKEFRNIPKGMLPMCYPADQYDGNFIPNWAMWFVIELADYQKRSGDKELAQKLKKRVYELVDYFIPFENEFGLLEKLENWVFVEWSKANDLVQDVNYPSNMLYSLMLQIIGALYGDPTLTKKGEKIAQTIRERAFDGSFFVDNEVRENGELRLTGERTETCQYYAFFCGVATPDSHPGLWKVMTEEFGPDRSKKGLYPEIYPSNAFIGNYLRLDVLSEYGLKAQCLQEIEGYFLAMAEKTGTLWENMTDCASCNHGFASYAAYLIDKNSD